MKTLSTHQPNYLPYLGFFDKIKRSDVFVVLDDVQFCKRDFHHRNQIRTNQGSKWLTIPVDLSQGDRIPIKDIKIKSEIDGKPCDWAEEHCNLISNLYRSAPFFKEYFPALKEVYQSAKNSKNLAENNVLFIKFFMDSFGIKTPVVFSSEANINTKSTQRLIDLCKHFGADEYLSGNGAKEYMDESMFEKAGIKLTYQDFKHPEYKQIHGEFVPYMSAVDYLFNCGGKKEGGDNGLFLQS